MKKHILPTPIRQQKDILEFQKNNKGWIAGFTCADGSFISSLYYNKKALWGFWPQFEYNQTQSTRDQVLLKAINEYFDNTGSIYGRVGNVSQLCFRRKEVIRDKITELFGRDEK